MTTTFDRLKPFPLDSSGHPWIRFAATVDASIFLDDILFGSDVQRGSFNDAELNLMSQVRDVRRKMTQRKHITVP